MAVKLRIRGWLGFALLLMMVIGGACSRDVRLAGRKIPTVEVRSVAHYGLILDGQASPTKVAYAALLAIREDLLAADKQTREAALDKQFDLCAANVIQDKNRTSIDRDQYVYNVVYRWTPTVSHYVDNFDVDWETAKDRLVRRDIPQAQWSDPGVEECAVLMELDDPNGESNARVVLAVFLARDSGFWRVVHLGFDNQRRSIGN